MARPRHNGRRCPSRTLRGYRDRGTEHADECPEGARTVASDAVHIRPVDHPGALGKRRNAGRRIHRGQHRYRRARSVRPTRARPNGEPRISSRSPKHMPSERCTAPRPPTISPTSSIGVNSSHAPCGSPSTPQPSLPRCSTSTSTPSSRSTTPTDTQLATLYFARSPADFERRQGSRLGRPTRWRRIRSPLPEPRRQRAPRRGSPPCPRHYGTNRNR